MKYLQLFTNKYTLALTAIMMLGLLCIMATSSVTPLVILIKTIGFGLFYAYYRLFKVWSKQGKVDAIKDLFNDNEED
jgi:hypothetical protein